MLITSLTFCVCVCLFLSVRLSARPSAACLPLPPQQLQDAPGRQVDTRCTSGGIDHSFINWLVYGNKLFTSGIRIRIYAHGEGTMNSLGGLRPDTVAANITGDVRDFWKVLNRRGEVLNWSGEVSGRHIACSNITGSVLFARIYVASAAAALLFIWSCLQNTISTVGFLF
jgi:hypothetical protein